MRSDQQQAINRLAGTSATAFLCAVLCVYPLYIDKFSNLGVTKFTGCFTLFLLFLLWLVACTAIGARAPRLRNANAGRDVTLWGVLAFAGTSLISTFTSLSPTASTWGLGGYYGGLMLVLFTAAGYWAVRSYLDLENLDFVFWVLGITTSIVAVLYVLNIFNIDLIGAYADTAVVERAQFFSTLGQKDFNGCFFSVALPIVFYQFLNAKDTRTAVWTGIPAAFGALALAVVDSEALALGIGAAVMVLVCHKNFTTRHLRRAALISAAFFGWAAWMHYMRASVYTQGGTALLAKLGAWQVALPCMAASLLLWLVLFVLARKGIAAQAPLYLPGRVITIAVLAVGALAFVLANAMPNRPLPESLHNLLVFNDDWGTYRGVAWRAAFGTWADGSLLRKIVGIGPGMMHTAVAAWAGDAMTARMATFYAAHNEYLEQLLTTGILGLAAWLLLVAAHLQRGERSWNTPGVAPVMLALCSYLAQAVVSIRVSMVFPLVMLLFGALAALTAPELPQPAAPAPRGKKQQKPEPLPPKNAWYFAKTVLVAVLCMAAASGIAPLLFGFLMG